MLAVSMTSLAGGPQTYGMGNKAEMLVTVRAPEGREGRVRIALTTDLATEAVLHWGVRRGRAQDLAAAAAGGQGLWNREP